MCEQFDSKGLCLNCGAPRYGRKRPRPRIAIVSRNELFVPEPLQEDMKIDLMGDMIKKVVEAFDELEHDKIVKLLEKSEDV